MGFFKTKTRIIHKTDYWMMFVPIVNLVGQAYGFQHWELQERSWKTMFIWKTIQWSYDKNSLILNNR